MNKFSRKATCNSHGQDSSYFLGWQEYEKNPYDEFRNPSGIIQMGLAENQVWKIKNKYYSVYRMTFHYILWNHHHTFMLIFYDFFCSFLLIFLNLGSKTTRTRQGSREIMEGPYSKSLRSSKIIMDFLILKMYVYLFIFL